MLEGVGSVEIRPVMKGASDGLPETNRDVQPGLADGCFSAADGGLDWVVPDAEIDRAAAGATRPSTRSCSGGGRTSMLAAFWPKVDTDAPSGAGPAPPGTGLAGAAGLRHRAEHDDQGGLLANPEAGDLEEFAHRARAGRALLEALKRQPGKDMLLLGSGSIASQLTQHGLIDESSWS